MTVTREGRSNLYPRISMIRKSTFSSSVIPSQVVLLFLSKREVNRCHSGFWTLSPLSPNDSFKSMYLHEISPSILWHTQASLWYLQQTKKKKMDSQLEWTTHFSMWVIGSPAIFFKLKKKPTDINKPSPWSKASSEVPWPDAVPKAIVIELGSHHLSFFF